MDKIRVLMAKPGLDGHDRGVLVISQALRDAGMEVIYTGLRQSPKQIVTAAIQEDVDAVGLSSLSGAHNVLFPEVLKLLREAGAEDILVFGGGVIPAEDIKLLEKQGIKKIFTPGTSTKTVATYIERAVLEARGEVKITAAAKPQGIDHIGIAVNSIDSAAVFYRNHFQLEVETVVELPSQQVKVAFLPLGNVTIELLEPLTGDGVIAKFLEKNGEGLHHIAFAVDDVQQRLDQLKREGVQLIDEVPKKGARGNNIAFLHPKQASRVLVELCESHDTEGG
ncbi:methylmalonyl-CoA mutase, C-terminal domain [Evansella caseinilytica]|uniref:Methylmalonyl-CoA mutase, C-terminal domain n=1 Tax=Evansella caseinilytica TaxID=1503961 RepID=A0A1H3L099_9BACI|nr:methylmalonyl-CoA epimerase [Evansella caseinilytica]SDY57770.1 methylmalonyl-CoA mutase, C-terminal domain [Evansella caseinilytica]